MNFVTETVLHLEPEIRITESIPTTLEMCYDDNNNTQEISSNFKRHPTQKVLNKKILLCFPESFYSNYDNCSNLSSFSSNVIGQ